MSEDDAVMSIALKIILCALLLLLVSVVLLVLYRLFTFYRKIKLFFSSLKGFANVIPPSRITLKAEQQINWNRTEGMLDCKMTLEKLGFKHAGDFSVKEMPLTFLAGYIHPASHVLAAVYDHDKLGTWTDIFVPFENGSSLTISNTPQGGSLDSMPGMEKKFMKNAPIQELYHAIIKDLSGRSSDSEQIRVLKVEEFASEFEETYAKEMDWRNTRGGASADEVKRIAGEISKPFHTEIFALKLGE